MILCDFISQLHKRWRGRENLKRAFSCKSNFLTKCWLFPRFCWQFQRISCFIHFISFNLFECEFRLFFFRCFYCFTLYFARLLCAWHSTRKPHILFEFNFTQGTTEFATRCGKSQQQKSFFHCNNSDKEKKNHYIHGAVHV